MSIAVVASWTVGTSLGAQLHPREARPLFRARRQRGGSRLLCRITGFRATMAGRAPSPGPMLFVSNHFTALDPILIATQVDVSFAGKIAIMGWPVLGWIAKAHGIIGVERRRRSSASSFVASIQKRMKEGVPVMVFPEGGISWGDTVLPFKTAAFQAVAGEGHVQPVFLDVVAIEGRPTPADEGRYVLSYNHHDTLFGHIAHVLSFKTVDVSVSFGPSVDGAGLKRKVLATMTRDALLILQQKALR